jgi:predicted SprT family Zn-dependent metalloprotease
MEILEAKKEAVLLLAHHGLLDKGWYFEFDNAKRAFGRCYLGQKKITLSKPLTLLNSLEKVTDVILHEIAHALVGSGHGHDAVWVAKALEIGCNGKRCYGDEVTKPKGKYLAVCCNCGKEYPRYKKPVGNLWCKCDNRKWLKESILVWNKLG